MKIVVMSDSHGNAEAVEKVITQNPDANGFYHLGDGWRDFAFTTLESGIFRIGLRGNCDITYGLPQKDVRTIDDVRIAAMHGEDFHGLADAVMFGTRENAKVVLHGHTHISNIDFTNGVFIICPGTLKYGITQTYAVIEIKNGIVKPEIKRL